MPGTKTHQFSNFQVLLDVARQIDAMRLDDPDVSKKQVGCFFVARCVSPKAIREFIHVVVQKYQNPEGLCRLGFELGISFGPQHLWHKVRQLCEFLRWMAFPSPPVPREQLVFQGHHCDN